MTAHLCTQFEGFPAGEIPQGVHHFAGLLLCPAHLSRICTSATDLLVGFWVPDPHAYDKDFGMYILPPQAHGMP